MPLLPAENSDPLQAALLAGGALFLLFHFVNGWRLGLPRAAARLVALAAAWFGGQAAMPLSPPVLQPFVRLPDAVLAVFGAALAGVMVYLAVVVAAAALFKRTRHQKPWIARFIFGSSGAVFGLATGLVLLWGILVALRLLGSFAQSQVPSAPPDVSSARAAVSDQPRRPAPGPIVTGLARLRGALDATVLGTAAALADPVPEETHRIIEKTGRLLADPQALRRLADYPPAAALAGHPRIRALAASREIQTLVQRRDYLRLLGHELVVAAANDPEISEIVRDIPAEKALDFALGIPRESAPPRLPPRPAEI